jgi:carboxyl-terminal processing protease
MRPQTCIRWLWTRRRVSVVAAILLGLCPSGGMAGAPGSKTQVPPAPFEPAACFDKVWNAVREQFWDPNFNGVDWTEAGKRYRPRALVAAGHEDFAAVVNEMLAELRTSHTCYLTKWDQDYYGLQAVMISQNLADLCSTDPARFERDSPGHYSSGGRPHRVGIGIVTRLIEGGHYVAWVVAESPAQKAGVLLGDRLVEVDGQPFHPIRSFADKAGREVELVLQRSPEDSSRRTVKLTPVDKEERELFEEDSFLQTRILEHEGHRLAYLPLYWLSGWRMRAALDKGFDLARESEGLIIDLRHGFGGTPPREYLDPFLCTELQGTTVESVMRDRRNSSRVTFGGPIIVLTDARTRSGKELLAYYFQKTGRATLLGERTGGHVSGGRPIRICKDSLLYLCVMMITVDGKPLEGVGVEPDIEVPFDLRFAAGRDLQLERAQEELAKRCRDAR